MKDAYMKLITDLDKTLRLASVLWTGAEPKDKPKINETINELLDERLRLMKIRDSL